MSTTNPNAEDKLMNWVADRNLRDAMDHERNERVMTEKYRGAFIVMSLVAIFQIGVLLFVSRWMPFRVLASQPVADAAETTLWRTTNATVEMSTAKYDELELGSSYGEVCHTLGTIGQELARCRFPGATGVMEPIETVVYGWVNTDGSSLHATFQNDKLIARGQSRLGGEAAK
jgi:hypothetical protein